MKEAAKTIDQQLKGKYWLVADRITLADITVFSALVLPFSITFDENFCKNIPNLCLWFAKVSKLPFVVNVAGKIKLKYEPTLTVSG